MRSAIVAMTIANVNIDTRKTKPFQPTDFMPFARQNRRRESVKPMGREAWERTKLLAAAYAGME